MLLNPYYGCILAHKGAECGWYYDNGCRYKRGNKEKYGQSSRPPPYKDMIIVLTYNLQVETAVQKC